MVDDFKNSSGIEFRGIYFAALWKLFSQIFLISGKAHHVGLIK